MTIVSMNYLLEAGVQFGHQKRRWNPKMREYIFTTRDDIYIIDLQKTVKKLEEAYAAMKEIAENGGKVLFVGTKKQAQEAAEECAVRTDNYFVNERWLGGTLTNFKTIRSRIRRMEEIENMEKDGTFEALPKKEVIQIKKEYDKLVKNLRGIREMKRMPQAMVIVDPRKEEIAIKEARILGIPVFGIVDTNCDPDMVDYVIPGNDDAVRSVKLLTAVMADAICEAKGAPLEVAYTKDEGEEVSMSDVIKSSDKQAEARRQAKLQREREDRAAQQARFAKRDRKPRVAKEEKKEAPAAEATPVVEEAAPATENTENN